LQPCAIVVAPSIRATSTSLQRRQDVAARELLAHVEHVRARRPDRQRAFAHIGQLAPLAEIERHGDHFRVVFFRQPGNRHRRVEPAGVRENDSFHVRFIPSPTHPAGP
jgi:hypothetical protein